MLATQYKIVDILHPLFVDNPSNYLYASPIHHTHHNHGAVAAAAAASMTSLTPAAPSTSAAASRIDSGFSTASGIATSSTTGGGAFRQPLSHHHTSSPPSLSSQQQISSSHAFQPSQGKIIIYILLENTYVCVCVCVKVYVHIVYVCNNKACKKTQKQRLMHKLPS